MAIQKAINSTIGAAATAVIAGQKLLEKATISEEQGLLAKEQYHEASAELTKLQGESAEAGKLVKETSTAYDEAMAKKPGGKGNTKAAIVEKQNKALTEKEAAQRAFDELTDRIEAKKAMQLRAETIMKRTGTWGGIK